MELDREWKWYKGPHPDCWYGFKLKRKVAPCASWSCAAVAATI